MVQNDATHALFAPGLAEQDRTRRRLTERFQAIKALPIRGWSRRTSPAPCSGSLDESRHATGVALPIDAGSVLL
jgi:hypothetical protein